MSLLVDTFIVPFGDSAVMRRALVGVIALSLGAAPMGVLLMLRRMSLMGDAMAHAMLPGAAIGYAIAGLNFVAMAIGGLIAGFAVALLSGLVARSTEIKEEASLASFYLISLALGVAIVSIRGNSDELLHLLFGDALAMGNPALILIACNATLTLLTLAVIWRPLVLECVDPLFLRSVSRAGAPVHMLFLALLTINLVSGFVALGTLLAVGMMVLPATIARFWTRDITAMVGVAAASAMLAGYCGLVLSYRSGVPPGPSIILVAAVLAAISLLFGRAGGLLRQVLPGRHLEA